MGFSGIFIHSELVGSSPFSASPRTENSPGCAENCIRRPLGRLCCPFLSRESLFREDSALLTTPVSDVGPFTTSRRVFEALGT